jgi:hypothetical protein
MEDVHSEEMFFENSPVALKSSSWLMRSMQSKYSDSFLAPIQKSRLWMQTYYLKAGLEVAGLESIMVHVSKPTSDADGKTIALLLDVLVATVKLNAELFGPCPTSDLEVIVMLNDRKKRLHKGRPLTTDAINSGFTSHDVVPLVVVFREEECHKVLIHELLHFWGVHEAFPPPDLVLPNNFPPRALVCESYIEVLATLITCAYTVGDEARVKARIGRELVHNESNAYRVTNCDAGDTNVWAYVVGKCHLMRGLDAFVIFVEQGGGLKGRDRWQELVRLMATGAELPVAPEFAGAELPRVSGHLRMVACEPEAAVDGLTRGRKS